MLTTSELKFVYAGSRELKLQCDANNEKIEALEEAKAEFSQQLEAAKDQFRDSIVNSTRFFELKASSIMSDVQQSASAVHSAQESSQQKFKHLAALIKKSEEFLYAHILTAEDKLAQLGQMLNIKLAQGTSVLDQKLRMTQYAISSISH